MVELTLQGILSTPFEPKGITGGKSVYHVSKRVFRMSPVYTGCALAPGSRKMAMQARRADRSGARHMSIARSGLVLSVEWIQGLRASRLPPGYLLAAPSALQDGSRTNSEVPRQRDAVLPRGTAVFGHDC